MNELNEFQKAVLMLWEEQKKTGLVIETCRQIGKTTVALEIAASEVRRGNRVLFYSFKKSIINNIRKQYEKLYGLNNAHLIEFKSVNDKRPLEFKPKYKIYDESILRIDDVLYDRIKEPNTLKLFTEIEEGYYRFNHTWLENKKIDIEMIRREMGNDEIFAKEYNCGVVEKDME